MSFAAFVTITQSVYVVLNVKTERTTKATKNRPRYVTSKKTNSYYCMKERLLQLK